MSSDRLFSRVPQQFCGRWNQKRYTLLRELGRGANGVVYLAACGGRRVAVKIGSDSFDLLMEVNMLKRVQSMTSLRVGPALLEVDDVSLDGQLCPFYAMEYVEGDPLDEYVERFGTEWAAVLLIQVLTRLEVLHQMGWVFGDVKPENILVGRVDKQVRLIDFGGVSEVGRAVRQFTEDYDRGAWQAGDRRAEPAYDLFAAALLMIRLAIGREAWNKLRNPPRHRSALYDIIRDNKELHGFRDPIWKALHGKYGTAAQMRREMVALLRQRAQGGFARQRRSSADFWIGGMFVASLLLLASSLFYLWM